MTSRAHTRTRTRKHSNTRARTQTPHTQTYHTQTHTKLTSEPHTQMHTTHPKHTHMHGFLKKLACVLEQASDSSAKLMQGYATEIDALSKVCFVCVCFCSSVVVWKEHHEKAPPCLLAHFVCASCLFNVPLHCLVPWLLNANRLLTHQWIKSGS